ncbi:hypothetical protein TIFTF001_017411 [Ficus carica]|uniref:Retrotransposon gag domain-containing protein n=1 Tax=Ficus carica TaxID=3494 RepID=A0AA88A4Z2_FICCA|nr:hypothetical protein TIFTF001_017411 [Ficus carica]
MVRPCTQANPNPQEPDLANVVAMLQQQVQANPPLIREDLLYERFRRTKAPEFEGPADQIEANNWLIDIQVILDFMGLSGQEKVLYASFALKKDARRWWMTVQMLRNMTTMSWQDFVTEFRAMYYNREILTAQQDEFNSFRQGSMTVMEAIKKFEQLARLCPELLPNETEKVRRMMKMFRTDIVKQVSSGSNPPTLVSDCINRAIRAKVSLVMLARILDSSGGTREREMLRVRANRGVTLRRRARSNACYIYGKEGHYARNCTLRNPNPNPQFQNRNPSSQLHAAQVKIEGPSLAQEKLKAPKPQARIYAYIKGDIEAGTSSVVTVQISVTTYDTLALLDFGAIIHLYRRSLPRN